MNELVRLFGEKYPDYSDAQIRGKYRNLLSTGIIAVADPVIVSDEKFVRVMRCWNFSHQLATAGLYNRVCCFCSRLHSPCSKVMTHVTEDIQENDLPLARHYGLGTIPDNISYQDTQGRFLRCNTCSLQTNLLDAFALVPPEIHIEPLPDMFTDLSYLEKAEIAICALFSSITKRADAQRGQYEHRQGEVNALNKKFEGYVCFRCLNEGHDS